MNKKFHERIDQPMWLKCRLHGRWEAYLMPEGLGTVMNFAVHCKLPQDIQIIRPSLYSQLHTKLREWC